MNAFLSRILHFALFVIGCVETNARNRMPRTVYVLQPVYGPPAAATGPYHPLAQLPVQPQPGQPQAQSFIMGPAAPLPAQTLITHGRGGKTDAEWYA